MAASVLNFLVLSLSALIVDASTNDGVFEFETEITKIVFYSNTANKTVGIVAVNVVAYKTDGRSKYSVFFFVSLAVSKVWGGT